MRLNFRQGLITYQKDITGKPTYLIASQTNPGFVNLVVSPTPLVITFAHGASDYLATFDQTINNAWGPVTPGVNNYFYWEMDPVTGRVSQGITTIQPVFNAKEPARIPEQSWFDATNKKMMVWQAQSGKWVERIRLFAGRASFGSLHDIVMYDAGSQVDLNTPSNPGYPMLDSQLRPLRSSVGEFLTTNSTVYIKNTIGTAGVLAVPTNAFIPVKAGESIPAMSLVYFSGPDTVSLASSDPALINRRTPVGVMQEALVTNEVGALTQYGDITFDQWNWDGHFGQPVYSDNFGRITTTRPGGLLAYRVGFIKNKNTIVFAIDAETEPQVYQATESHIIVNGISPIHTADVINAIGERVISVSIQPSSGNIQDGYMSKEQAQLIIDSSSKLGLIDQKILALDSGKADKMHIHTIGEVTGLQAALDSKFPLNGNFDTRYALINHLHTGVYAPVIHTHSVSEVDGLNARLAAKADRLTSMLPFNRVFETIDQTGGIDADQGDNLIQALGKKANTVHTHTIAQVDGLQSALDGKAALLHNHSIDDVIGLQTALDGRALVVHTHVISDVIGLLAALDNKSDKGHTHTILEVDGLENRLVTLQTNIDNKTFASLTDVVINSPQAGNFIGWNGTKWANMVPVTGVELSTSGSSKVFVNSFQAKSTDGSVLVATTTAPDGSKTVGSIDLSASLSKLTDVDLGSLSPNHILTFDGAKWTNKPLVVSNLGLSGLTDVNITTPTNPASYLGWNTATSKWINRLVDLKEITGVIVGSPTSNMTLVYDAGQNSFVAKMLNIGDLANVNVAGATASQVLTFDGSIWKPAASTGGSMTLSGLTDVTITTPTSTQLLSFNGTKWVNTNVSAIQGLKLTQMTDVSINTPAAGQVLTWNGVGLWEAKAAPLGLPIGGTTGQILSKTSATNGAAQWVNAVIGLPSAGNVGQFLVKNGTGDGQTGWQNAPLGMPTGGLVGQTLTKVGTGDGQASWQTPPIGIPAGGLTGQILSKTGTANGAAGWTDAPKVQSSWLVFQNAFAANAAIADGTATNGTWIDILKDETHNGFRTLNNVAAGVLNMIQYAEIAAYVGFMPAEVPTNSQLGALAFRDSTGITQVYRHRPITNPGDMWTEWVGATTTQRFYHGLDNIIRTVNPAATGGGTEEWTSV